MTDFKISYPLRNNKNFLFLLICFSILFMSVAVNASYQSPIITSISMDFYGSIVGAMPGDRLEVKDDDNVLCGLFEIHKENQYGFIHVYGDDPTTQQDEGPKIGDQLTFYLNGVVLNGSQIQFKGDRIIEKADWQITP